MVFWLMRGRMVLYIYGGGRCLSVFNNEGNESTEAKIVEEYERRMKGRSIYSSREI